MKARRPFPEHGALVRARALLLDTGVELPVRSWADLATIYDTPWLPALPRSTPAAARVLRRRLTRLSSPALTVAGAAAGPRGEIVRVDGRAAAFGAGKAPDTLWSVSRADDEAGAWLEEMAEDFLLIDADGGRLLVSVDGGHLVGGNVLRAGDLVSVFGLVDDVPDQTGLFRSPHGRGGVAPALRSGSDWPLLLCKGPSEGP